MIRAQIPTAHGTFDLCLYRGVADAKEHVALVYGKVEGRADVLVRMHSECFTGEVFGSTRCDCQAQLAEALRVIANEGAGVVVYLRQEGRGIGLLNKLRAYNLQDLGYDTVDANLMLGHQPDEREYAIGAAILRDLGVGSLRLLTNNPAKIEALEALGFPRPERVPLLPAVTFDNASYLSAKAARMGHLFDHGGLPTLEARPPVVPDLEDLNLQPDPGGEPFVTLTYAQSLDGSISAHRGSALALSSPHSLAMTHALRAAHDALVVGIETVLGDDPSLTVRLVEGDDPVPVVLDSHLRTPHSARLLRDRLVRPLIATTAGANAARQRALEEAGARVERFPADGEGRVDLAAVLAHLAGAGVRSVMVEGGARVITSFLSRRLVDRVVLTIAPLFVGGLNAVESLMRLNDFGFPALRDVRSRMVGPDFVVVGDMSRAPDASADRVSAGRPAGGRRRAAPSQAWANPPVPPRAWRARQRAR